MGEEHEEREPARTEFIEKMKQLHNAVKDLSNLYEDNDWLNDEYSIASLVPMSLDDWEMELTAFLENPKGYYKP